MPRLRPSAQVFASLLCTSPTALILSGAAHAQNTPRQALVVALQGNNLTLSVGTDDGAKIGQTFRLKRGNAGATLQITALAATQSTAVIVAADAGFSVIVGDVATYLGQQTLPPLPAAPPAPTDGGVLARPNPAQALLTGVTGAQATLSIGSADGATLGAVYALPLAGGIRARLQITEVRADASTATITIVEEGFVPTVGDTARFVGVEALPARTLPAAPTTPATPAPQIEAASPNPNGGISTSETRAAPAPVATFSGATATVTEVRGGTVTISAGRSQGARAAQSVPILRGGEIIGLLRLQVVSENSASGVVLYRDEALTPIAPGDAVGLLGIAPGVAIPGVGTPQDEMIVAQNPAPATVSLETGAPNFAVPKANPAYELLAALASSGLIQSQPPSVFQDDGARRHRTAEDIVFSRAQVAGFIREAIGNAGASSGAGDTEISSRDRAALGLLSREFRRDLVAQGETEATLAPFIEGRGFGVSGFSRFTVAGSDTDASNRDPFSESYGARRSKTGIDSRTNVFGQVAPNLSVYGSVDYGNDIRRGNSNIIDIGQNSGQGAGQGRATDGQPINNLQVRKAFLSYDAQSLLRGLTVNLGRKEFWWGPGQFGTTTLGDAPGGLNSLSTVFERGSYRLEGLYSPLGRGPRGGARSLYGQNLSVAIGSSVRIGATTTILSPKDGFDPKLFLGAFTPISLYVLDRQGGRNRGGVNANTNAVVGAYAEAAVACGARVYGEIVLDDIAVNERNGVENRNGSLVGVQVFNPRNPAKAGFTAEYARLNSISYLAFLGSLDQDYYYRFRGAPLGYPVSPVDPTTFGGSESLRFEGHYQPLARLRLHAGLEYADINTEDQAVARSGERGFSRQQIYRFAAAYNLSRSFTLTARAQKIDTNQPNFVKNEGNQPDKFFSLEIGRSF